MGLGGGSDYTEVWRSLWKVDEVGGCGFETGGRFPAMPRFRGSAVLGGKGMQRACALFGN